MRYVQNTDEVFEVGLLDSGGHDFHHLHSNLLLLGCLGIAGGLNLSWGLLGESDREHSHDVAISGLGLHEGFDKRVPFLNHSATMVSGDIHSVEISVTVISLDFINLELQLSPGCILLLFLNIVAVI